jgi:Tfp pilus assembly protein PilX
MKNRGMTLFISIVIMGILLFVSFVVVNIAIKSTLFASSGRDSQLAFFAADSGIECSLYWDTKADAFNTGNAASWAEVHIMEFSGISLSNALDKATMKSGGGSSNPVNAATNQVTTSFGDELIVGYLDQWYCENCFVNPGSGFTELEPNFSQLSHNYSDMVEYRTTTSAGSYNATFSITNPGRVNKIWGALMATFRAATGETPAFVQHATGDKDNPGSPVPFDNPSTSGNLIVVAFQYDTADFVIDSITDNKDNNYSRAVGPLNYLDNGEPRSQEMWYAQNITGGGSPIVITAHSQAFVPSNIFCNGQTFTAGEGPWNPSSNRVQTIPAQIWRIGGNAAAENDNTSIFQLSLSNGSCSIVRVEKDPGQPTRIESRGYNTCDTGNPRRVERGLYVTY